MTSSPQKRACFLLVEDHPTMLEALSDLLIGDNHTISGIADSIEGANTILDGCHVDIAMIDLSLDGENGLDLIHRLMKDRIPTIVYSMHEDATTLHRTLNQGAKGFITKREPPTVILEGVQKVLAGDQYVSPRVIDKLDPALLSQSFVEQGIKLSKRENQILVLMAQNNSSTEIGKALGLSRRTVETYYTRIINKLSLDGMKALRKHAVSESRLLS